MVKRKTTLCHSNNNMLSREATKLTLTNKPVSTMNDANTLDGAAKVAVEANMDGLQFNMVLAIKTLRDVRPELSLLMAKVIVCGMYDHLKTTKRIS